MTSNNRYDVTLWKIFILLNSYDTWHGETLIRFQCGECSVVLLESPRQQCQNTLYILHALGTKNVAKGFAKIMKGRAGSVIKDQLSDKREFCFLALCTCIYALKYILYTCKCICRCKYEAASLLVYEKLLW